MLPDKGREYLLHGLSATPDVIDRLLRDASAADFDRRPDPARFTIREVIAHLADWESIWMERLSRMRSEDNPLLPGYDEGQLAIDHNYGQTDIREQQQRFRAGRERLLGFLRDLRPQDWSRRGLRDEVGPLDIEGLATFVLGHDGYHTKQIAQLLNAS